MTFSGLLNQDISAYKLSEYLMGIKKIFIALALYLTSSYFAVLYSLSSDVLEDKFLKCSDSR